MSGKKILYSKEARAKLKEGVNETAAAVSVTLGPGGKNVMIDLGGLYGSRITKDGVTVARNIKFSDPVKDMACQLMKKVSGNTDDTVGDGTTTAMILANEMVNIGFKEADTVKNMFEYGRGMNDALEHVLKELETYTHIIDIDKKEGVKDIENIAMISSNGDKEISKNVIKAIAMVGNDGSIRIGSSQTRHTRVEKKKGLSYDMGMISPFFVTDKANAKSVLVEPYILATDIKLNSLYQMQGLLEAVAETGKPLFIIVEDISKEAIATFIRNMEQGALSVCIVKAPEFGDERKKYLEDIAVMTGAKALFSGAGHKLEEATINDLGKAERVDTDYNKFTIIGGKGDKEKIKERIQSIYDEYKEEKDSYYKDRYNERYAKLKAGVSMIYIGATSEIEMFEKKYRYEDTLHAVKNSIDSGYIAGAGVPLFRIHRHTLENIGFKDTTNKDYIKGWLTVINAIQSPFKVLFDNLGYPLGDSFIKKIVSSKKVVGMNLKTMEFGDLIELGVIDPVKITITALRNAVSITKTLLTTEAVIFGEEQEGKYETSDFL